MNAMNCSVQLTASASLNFELPASIQVQTMQSQPPRLSKEPEVLKPAIARALDHSHGYALHDVVKLEQPVLIVVDDHTRGTPVLPTLDVLYERLRAIGVTDEQLTILIAAGTHRPMTDEELRQRLGRFFDLLRVEQHDCHDADRLFSAGQIENIPIVLNTLIQQAGTVIGIGSIVAHKFSGWSGAGKIICPGVAGYQTIFLSHRRALVEETIQPGMSANWHRTFIDQVAKLAGLTYLINYVPGVGGIFDVLAGEPQTVLSHAIGLAREQLSASFQQRFDIVVMSAFPGTMDLWQSGKGFYTGNMLVKDGGTIVLVSPLDEGLGDHPAFISTLEMDLPQIQQFLYHDAVPDPLASAAAYAVREIATRCALRIVSTNQQLQHRHMLGHEITADIQHVIDESITTATRNLVICQDVYVLPTYKEEQYT
jgi:nickel-dependent lactate racemase